MMRRSDDNTDPYHAVSYTIPTETVESDGTLVWDSTTMVIVHAEGGGKTGLGYSYCHKSVAMLINDKLAPLVQGLPVMHLPLMWRTMVHGCRNLGDASLVMMAVAAVDNSLWDLKAKILDLPLVTLLGGARQSVPIYGSGGFTSYDLPKLTEQLSGWRDAGITRMKMKIGRDPEQDPLRVQAARQAIGDAAELMVDANGAFTVKEAMAMAERLVDCGVSWFEEPVQHRDLQGLHLLRRRCPAGIEITAGEYGFNLDYFTRMITAERSMFSRPMPPAVPCRSSSRWPIFARPIFFPFPPIPPRRCTVMSAVRCCRCAILNIFMTMSALNRCSSMACRSQLRANSGRIWICPGMGLVLKEQDIEQFAD